MLSEADVVSCVVHVNTHHGSAEVYNLSWAAIFPILKIHVNNYSEKPLKRFTLWHVCNSYVSMCLLSFERVLLSTASPPRYWGRFWAAIRLSHCPEPSGRVVRGEVDGLDSGGRHGRRFVLRQTHRPQRRPYPICTGRSGNVWHQCGGGWVGPRLFLEGSFRGCVYRCLELKCGVLWGRPHTPRSIDDPPTAPHVCWCCQKNWWVVVWQVQMGVSIWGGVQLHRRMGECWVEQVSWLQIVWLLCDEAQQVGCLRGLEGCPLM